MHAAPGQTDPKVKSYDFNLIEKTTIHSSYCSFVMHQEICIFYAPIGDSHKLLVFWSTRWSQKDAKFTIHTVIAGVSEISIFWEVFRFIKKYLTSGAESYIGELKSQFSMLNLTSLMGNGFYWQFFWSTVFIQWNCSLSQLLLVVSENLQTYMK